MKNTLVIRMNKWDFYRLLLILGLVTLNGFLVWSLYSIIMTVVAGINAVNLGTIVLGGILLWMFGGLIILGVLVISIVIVGLIFGVG